jgi:zinc/manganese transport system substrate-binding protein
MDTRRRIARALGRALALAALAQGAASLGRAAETLRVVATVPDLGSLAQAVGGDAVDVTVLVKGPQDPHFLEPRPSFVRALHDADLFVVVGMDLEIGWVPPLLGTARNPGIAVGGPGYVDASTAIVPLEVPQGAVTRALGDVHPFGNPHYLTDPVNGLRVAALLRDRLAAARLSRGAVVVIDVATALPLVTPAYDVGSTEAELRAHWARHFRAIQPGGRFADEN